MKAFQCFRIIYYYPHLVNFFSYDNFFLATGLNDGAAVVVLMSLEDSTKRGAKPLAKIVAYATAGVPPEIMGTGPIPAVQKAVKYFFLAFIAICFATKMRRFNSIVNIRKRLYFTFHFFIEKLETQQYFNYF
jgi:hypothetical protein